MYVYVNNIYNYIINYLIIIHPFTFEHSRLIIAALLFTLCKFKKILRSIRTFIKLYRHWKNKEGGIRRTTCGIKWPVARSF